MRTHETTQVGDSLTTYSTAALVTTHGLGKELCDHLRKVLNIPEGVRWFEVRFAKDEAISVQCEYLPRQREEQP